MGNKDSPFERPDVEGYVRVDDLDLARKGGARAGFINFTTFGGHDGWVPVGVNVTECGCTQSSLSEDMQGTFNVGDDMFMIMEPPWARGGDADNCIQDNNVVGMSVLCMILFSLCVQAAEGLHYGIVPYVSRPALGVVSGMVGAGGNLGAVISLSAFFKGKDMRTDVGFQALGLMDFIYFPDMGCMLLPRGALGKYDPQIIKPPADYRGADHMDFSAVKDPKKGKEE